MCYICVTGVTGMFGMCNRIVTKVYPESCRYVTVVIQESKMFVRGVPAPALCPS